MVHDLQLKHKEMKENRIVPQKTVQWMFQRPTQTLNDRVEYSKEQEMTPEVWPGRLMQDLRHSREASSIITSCCNFYRPRSSMVAAQRSN